MRVKLFVVSAILILLSIYLFGCGSPMLVGAKTALQENPPDWERAEKLTTQALNDTPNDWEAHMYMAVIHNHFGRYEKASTEFQKAKELAPDEKAHATINRKRFENAVSLMKENNYEKAAEEIENIDGEVAENSSELYNIGVLYLQLAKTAKQKDNLQDRKKYVNKAIDAFTKTVNMADHEVELAENKRGLPSDQLKRIKKDAATSYSGLAMAYSADNDYDKAIEAYEKASELDPENEEFADKIVRMRYEAGTWFIEEGKYEEAVNYYNNLLKEHPDYTDSYFFIAQAYQRKAEELKNNGDEEGAKASEAKALESYEACLNANPKDAETLEQLYKAYAGRSDWEKAKEMAMRMTELIEVGVTTPVTYLFLGQACQRLEDKQGALEAYQTYIDKEPDDDKGYGLLGEVKEELEDYEGALAAYNTAIAKNPEDLKGYYKKYALLQKMIEIEKDAGNDNKVSEYETDLQQVKDKISELQEKLMNQ